MATNRIVYRCDTGHAHRTARGAAVCDRPDPTASPGAYRAWLRRIYKPEPAASRG